MSEPKLARIVYQVAKMLVGLMEKEFGFGKRIPGTTLVDDVQLGDARVILVRKSTD